MFYNVPVSISALFITSHCPDYMVYPNPRFREIKVPIVEIDWTSK